MHETIWDRLAKRAPRINDAEESRLEQKTRKALSNIKFMQRPAKKKCNARGGLYSMGARGVFVKENSIYSRRVVVKAKVKKNNGSSFKENLRKHLEYISRKGASLDGERPTLFSEGNSEVVLNNIENRFSQSDHNFRFILSPEDGNRINLKNFTNDLIKIMEQDLGTKIDWVASVHYDTNEPHVHLLIDGKDKAGERLLITRDYISNGIRNRASKIISNGMGFRSLEEIVKSIQLEINRNKKISLDDIINRNTKDGRFNLRKLDEDALDEMPKGLIEKRLSYLESNGLANQPERGLWKIKDNYWEALRELDRTQILVEQVCLDIRIDREKFEIVTAQGLIDKPLVGEVIKRGFVSELSEEQYLLVKSNEGKLLYVPLEKYSEKQSAKMGDVIKIEATKPFSGPKASDSTIDKEAKANGGIYDAHDHAKRVQSSISLPPGVSLKEYIDVHVKRLEVLARKGLVEKQADKTYLVPADYLQQLSLEEKNSQEKYAPHLKVSRLAQAITHKQELSKGLRPC